MESLILRFIGIRRARAAALAKLVAGCSEPKQAEKPRFGIVGTQKEPYSRHDEEIVVRDVLRDRVGGFFLDVRSDRGVAH